MKRISSLLLMAVLLLGCIFSTTACAKLDTSGLLEAAPELIGRAAFFNEIYYGEGIPYGAMGSAAIGNYYYADTAFLDEHGFHTVTELKTLTAEVFSQDYCEAIFAYAFSGFASETGSYVYARYSSSQPENLRDEDETILVSSVHEPMLTGETVYDYSTLTVDEVGKDYATVAIKITVKYPPNPEYPYGDSTESTIRIRFVNEDGWRIDSATY